jgi:deoxyribodipyrimidine photo-lyase
MKPILVWFRRDLRVDDHAALYHAARTGAPLVPLFIFDTNLIRRLPSDGAVFDFQAEALRDLGKNLRALGGALTTRRGSVLEVHRRILHELQPAALYYNRDYEPVATERDRRVDQLYRSAGVEVRTFKDSVLHEPSEVLTGSGRPYVVFTPFSNTWKKLSHPSPLGKPQHIIPFPLPSAGILGSSELRKKVLIVEPVAEGGEQMALRRWNRFLQTSLDVYARGRDLPGADGTSKLSPSLRFGCISPRRVLDDCLKVLEEASPDIRASIGKFVDELIWREFYQAVLFHLPRLRESNYREEFEKMPWKFDEKKFKAWKEGRTGYPLVDAGMRQLNRTGWMHNRVRMVVASFLTKDLMHDWRLGEGYFEEKLMDIETASNNGGWQWSAATGVDPKPLRIFNPTLQSERYDPEGNYIREFVPELRKVPAKFIHAPSAIPPTLQKELGVLVGKDYPLPIVHHAEASARYKEQFRRVKEKYRS